MNFISSSPKSNYNPKTKLGFLRVDQKNNYYNYNEINSNYLAFRDEINSNLHSKPFIKSSEIQDFDDNLFISNNILDPIFEKHNRNYFSSNKILKIALNDTAKINQAEIIKNKDNIQKIVLKEYGAYIAKLIDFRNHSKSQKYYISKFILNLFIESLKAYNLKNNESFEIDEKSISDYKNLTEFNKNQLSSENYYDFINQSIFKKNNSNSNLNNISPDSKFDLFSEIAKIINNFDFDKTDNYTIQGFCEKIIFFNPEDNKQLESDLNEKSGIYFLDKYLSQHSTKYNLLKNKLEYNNLNEFFIDDYIEVVNYLSSELIKLNNEELNCFDLDKYNLENIKLTNDISKIVFLNNFFNEITFKNPDIKRFFLNLIDEKIDEKFELKESNLDFNSYINILNGVSKEYALVFSKKANGDLLLKYFHFIFQNYFENNPLESANMKGIKKTSIAKLIDDNLIDLNSSYRCFVKNLKKEDEQRKEYGNDDYFSLGGENLVSIFSSYSNQFDELDNSDKKFIIYKFRDYLYKKIIQLYPNNPEIENNFEKDWFIPFTKIVKNDHNFKAIIDEILEEKILNTENPNFENILEKGDFDVAIKSISKVKKINNKLNKDLAGLAKNPKHKNYINNYKLNILNNLIKILDINNLDNDYTKNFILQDQLSLIFFKYLKAEKLDYEYQNLDKKVEKKNYLSNKIPLYKNYKNGEIVEIDFDEYVQNNIDYNFNQQKLIYNFNQSDLFYDLNSSLNSLKFNNHYIQASFTEKIFTKALASVSHLINHNLKKFNQKNDIESINTFKSILTEDEKDKYLSSTEDGELKMDLTKIDDSQFKSISKAYAGKKTVSELSIKIANTIKDIKDDFYLDLYNLFNSLPSEEVEMAKILNVFNGKLDNINDVKKKHKFYEIKNYILKTAVEKYSAEVTALDSFGYCIVNWCGYSFHGHPNLKSNLPSKSKHTKLLKELNLRTNSSVLYQNKGLNILNTDTLKNFLVGQDFDLKKEVDNQSGLLFDMTKFYNEENKTYNQSYKKYQDKLNSFELKWCGKS